MSERKEKTFDVSVIIVSYNTRDVLRNCLCSVFSETRKISFEVIVVDNDSRDGSAEMVADEFPQAVLVRNRDNRGFAAANNQGIRISRGGYVLLLNSDTVIIDGAIDKSFEFAETLPDAGVVGCKARNDDGSLQHTCQMYPGLLNLFILAAGFARALPNHRFFGRADMTWWDHNEIREVNFVAGCFMLVRRAAIEQVGVMDSNYFMYAEEVDWCLRFSRAGWRVIYYPFAEFYHLLGESGKSSVKRMRLERRKSLLYFFSKNYGPVKALAANYLFVFNDFLRLVPWLFAAAADCFRGKKQSENLAKLNICFETLGYHLFNFRITGKGKR